MGFNMKGGDKNSLALLSSKRTRAYSRTRADEAFALPSFSDAIPVTPAEPQQHCVGRSESCAERSVAETSCGRAKDGFEEGIPRPLQEPHDTTMADNAGDTQDVRLTMLQHESMFKEQVHELHRLYQKQCLLMAESEPRGPANYPPPRSEPPSTNSSPFPTSKGAHSAQKESSFGGAPACSKQDCRALTSQIGVAGPHSVESKNQDQQEARASRPIFDLELPAEEYMNVEEKPRLVDGTCRFVDAPATFLPEKRSGSPKLSFSDYDDRTASNSSNAKVFDGHQGQIGFFHDHHQETRKVPFPPLAFARATESLWQEPPSGPIPANKLPLFVQKEIEASQKGKASTDIEAEPRKPLALPGWLSQASPRSVSKAVPLDLSSDRQQKAKYFFPMMHDQGISSGLENPKSPAIRELLYPLLQSGSSSQGNIPFQSVARGIIGVPHQMGPENGFKSVGLPFLHSHVWDNQGMRTDTSGSSGYVTSDVREMCVEIQASMEPFARHSMRENVTSSTMLPWYRQIPHQERKPDPSVERPASGSFVAGGHELHSLETANRRTLQASITTSRTDTSAYWIPKSDTNGNDSHGRLPPPRWPESLWQGPVFDFIPAANTELGLPRGLSRRENDTARGKEVETFFCPGQASQADSEMRSLPDLNSRLEDFDLNVSISPCLAEKDDLHGFSCEQDGQCFDNEGLRQECGTYERSSGWRGMEARHAFEQAPVDKECPQGVYKQICRTETATKAGFFCSQVDMHIDSTRASVEDETGEQLVGGGKSSDGSGLTISESRDATKVIVHLKTSSGEACQSHESWSREDQKEDGVALSSNSKCRSMPLLDDKVLGVDCRSQQSAVENPSANAHHETKRMQFAHGRTEFGDESEVATNSTFERDPMDMAEAAELLLNLGCDLLSFDGKGKKGQEGPLEWFGDIIPEEGRLSGAMAAGTASFRGQTAEHDALEGTRETTMDPFESEILLLKPMNPDSEYVATKGSIDGDMVGGSDDLSSTHLRRRLSTRRGRAVAKDFHKRGALRSLSSLSRQEISEDLEIMEGMIKSCSNKKQGSRVFKEVCSSWCESARRRKQRGRRQSRWLSLPFPAVQA